MPRRQRRTRPTRRRLTRRRRSRCIPRASPRRRFLPPGGFDYRQPIRFLQEVRGRYTWLSPMGSQSLGVNDVDLSATFAIPFFGPVRHC